MRQITDSLLTCMNMHEYYNVFRGCQCPLICMASVVQLLLSIYNTKFISNRVDKILYTKESVINTDNCTFKYNRGPAMYLNKCKVDILNSVFNNNEAGALRLWHTIIHIHGSEFKENVNKGIRSYYMGRGGAIYSSDETIISFSDVCTFADNQAEQGGAIYLEEGA